MLVILTFFIFVSGWCVAVTGFYRRNGDDDYNDDDDDDDNDDDDDDDDEGRKARGKEKTF